MIHGIFTDVTSSVGLDETSGWWNCINISDVDGDGDLDIIGGNLGLNSLLKASKNEPVEMYLKDFDNNGSLDQIICSYQEGVSYPIASLDDLAAQITGLKKKFPNYFDFGGKSVKDIFGQSSLDQALIKSAVLFESCLFLNNGEGSFDISKLPVEAQFSPVRDILVSDFNIDGKMDLVLVGNDYSAIPYIGQYDASYGWCLLGDNSHRYMTLMPVKSGLLIEGDARKVRHIRISGEQYIVTAVNNGDLQVFKVLNQ